MTPLVPFLCAWKERVGHRPFGPHHLLHGSRLSIGHVVVTGELNSHSIWTLGSKLHGGAKPELVLGFRRHAPVKSGLVVDEKATYAGQKSPADRPQHLLPQTGSCA